MSTNALPLLNPLQASDPDSYLQHEGWMRQQIEDYQAHALQTSSENRAVATAFASRHDLA